MKMKWKTYKTGIRRAGLVALTGVILWTQPFHVFATAKAEREKQEAQQGLDEANQRADEAQQRTCRPSSRISLCWRRILIIKMNRYTRPRKSTTRRRREKKNSTRP